VAVVFVLDPIPQDLSYHIFVDSRSFFSVPNFLDVISNLPFLLVGALGVRFVLRASSSQIDISLRHCYLLFFASIAVVCFGSCHYHLAPGNDTLFWDRLPMTIAFMSLWTIVGGEFWSAAVAKAVFWLLVVVGLYSIWYWKIHDDLRIYALVQFLPLLTIPVFLFGFKPGFSHRRGYLQLLLCYALAKLCELADAWIYQFGQILSGHSLKHIFAALGIYLLLRSYKQRNSLPA
jgi:ribose/xylose/arabinose/galactoside ABC-type transport system permease subunit